MEELFWIIIIIGMWIFGWVVIRSDDDDFKIKVGNLTQRWESTVSAANLKISTK